MAPNDGERPFQVGLERIDGQCVVVFLGELDLLAVDELWEHIEQVRSSGQPIILDLSGTTFMDSTGIRLLLRAYSADGRVPEAITLRAPSEAVTNTLALAGVDRMFRVDDRNPSATGSTVSLAEARTSAGGNQR
jgi:anti-anti-sigma factor